MGGVARESAPGGPRGHSHARGPRWCGGAVGGVRWCRGAEVGWCYGGCGGAVVGCGGAVGVVRWCRAVVERNHPGGGAVVRWWWKNATTPAVAEWLGEIRKNLKCNHPCGGAVVGWWQGGFEK